MATSFQHFSVDEVGTGLRYAEKEFSIRLDRDMLRTLANDTGKRWYHQGRKPNRFQATKQEILLEQLSQRTSCETDRRNAYSSAVSKMFSNRAMLSKRQRQSLKQVASNTQSVDPASIGVDPLGQYIFLFPRQ